MALRSLVIDGDDTLRKTAKPVEKIDQHIIDLLEDMAETMYASNGIGIAAPQVGVLRRVFVVDLHDDNGLTEFINPRIVNAQGVQAGIEGCLSCPGISGEVERPEVLDIEAMDRHGGIFRLRATELLAVCISHENDHLDGILFFDKVKGELIRS
jgi:peptide deformylase